LLWQSFRAIFACFGAIYFNVFPPLRDIRISFFFTNPFQEKSLNFVTKIQSFVTKITTDTANRRLSFGGVYGGGMNNLADFHTCRV
jgi:hypothetical protein